jgi:hypothetical protein
VRLLLHHAEDEVRVNVEPRAVLTNQAVNARAARSPAALAPLALHGCDFARAALDNPLPLDAVNARALDED